MPRSSKKRTVKNVVVSPFRAIRQKVADFMARRPHRSFQLTRRRDYIRTLRLPGYFAFTHEVTKTVWKYRKVFSLLAVTYIFFYAILVGIGSQDTYASISETLQQTGAEIFEGGLDQISQAGLLFLSVFGLGAEAAASEAQQIFSALIILLIWLTTVWLLRNLLAGHKVKLRDGLYNSGAPIVSSLVITLVLVVQLLPVAIAAIGYTAASTSGLLDGGVEAMLFWIAAGLLGLLSLFWITGTLFALVVVTLPGMYPMKALKISGDIILGRRVRILLRWLWMAFAALIGWAVVLIPIILLDMGIKSLWPGIAWLPIVPVAILIVSAVTSVWISAYIYLLYRKVVDDEAA